MASNSLPPSQAPRNAPNWWLTKTKPLSIDKYCTPKICATTALVGGTVDSHSSPIVAENRYTLQGDSGAEMNATITTARSA